MEVRNYFLRAIPGMIVSILVGWFIFNGGPLRLMVKTSDSLVTTVSLGAISNRLVALVSLILITVTILERFIFGVSILAVLFPEKKYTIEFDGTYYSVLDLDGKVWDKYLSSKKEAKVSARRISRELKNGR